MALNFLKEKKKSVFKSVVGSDICEVVIAISLDVCRR